jgi:hypothetical protein
VKTLKDIWHDIRTGQNLDVYITAIVAFVIAILGIIGAPQNIVSSATLAILTIISVWLLQGRRENNEIRETLSKIDTLQSQFENLSLGLGTKATFVQLRKGEFRAASQSVRKLIKTSKELLVLDYNPPNGEDDKRYFDEEQVLERRKYYDEIIQKIHQGQAGAFRYRRILQVPEGIQLAELLANDQIFHEHCENVVRLGEKQSEFVSLKTCGILYQGTFSLIDRRILLFQVDIVDPNDKRRYDYGYFYFDDPSGSVAGHFARFFDRADAKASPVQLSELHK